MTSSLSVWAASRRVAVVMSIYARERRATGRIIAPALGDWLFRLGRGAEVRRAPRRGAEQVPKEKEVSERWSGPSPSSRSCG